MPAPADARSSSEAPRRGVVRMSTVAAGANVALLAIGAADVVITARLLGADGRGALFLLTTTVATVGVVVSCGLGPALQVAATQHRVAVGHTVRLTAAMSLLAGTVAVVAALLVGDAEVLRGLAVVGALLLAPELAVIILTPQFVVVDRVGRRSMIELGGAGLDLVLTAAFILSGGDEVFRAVIGVVIARWIFAGALVADLWRERGSSEPGWRRMAFSFGLRQHLGNLSGRAAKRADAFLLGGFLGADAVGVYSVASSLAELPLLVARAVQAPIVSFVARAPRAAANDVARAARTLVGLYAVGLPLFGMAGAATITPVFGGDFDGAVAPFLLLLFSTACWAVYLVLSGFFTGISRPGMVTLMVSVPLAVNVALSLVLIPSHGLVGNAVASCVGGLATAGIALVAFSRTAGTSFGEVLLPRRADLVGVVSLLRRRTYPISDATTP